MTLWLCATCGIEHADTTEPPARCDICSDERQHLPPGGQRWTTLAELAQDRVVSVEELEPDLYGITVDQKVGIGHRPLLVRTPAGNVLWDAPGFYDDALVEKIRDLGGLAAIASSHPHLTGVSVSLSHEFGGIPVLYNEDDRRWVRRPDDVIDFWRDTREVLPGLTLVQCGGLFAGSAVLHWREGAGGRGVAMSGVTFLVGADRATVTFMRSYPNSIPLPERSVRKIINAIEPWPFDRLYSGFHPDLIETDAHAAVSRSAERYIGWIRDELRDPDERT
ncbi:MAG: hydrolase [Chloroflexia bacterium]|nr:hydrolase [Chloroflexia bacterium]